MGLFDSIIPPEGSYHCGACPGAVARPGLCELCAAVMRKRSARHEFAAAIASLPASFSYAAPDNRAFVERAAVPSKPNLAVSYLIEKVIAGTVNGRGMYVFRGPSKRAKTSIMCAAARGLVDSAVAYRARAEMPAPRAQHVAVDPYLVRLAAGLRFVQAVDLVQPPDRGWEAPAPSFGIAIRAGLLILDAVGDETTTRATAEVIDRRWNAGLPTWITTFMAPEQIGTTYGGGIHRRLFHDERSRVFTWE